MSYDANGSNGLHRNISEATVHTVGQHGYIPSLFGISALIGNDVHNPENEKLGDIKDFVLDMNAGTIRYAVLSFGGFLGMGEKLFAVPWHALQLDTAEKHFTLNVPKERLQNAPGFDKDHWPDMADPSWQQEINIYYKTY